MQKTNVNFTASEISQNNTNHNSVFDKNRQNQDNNSHNIITTHLSQEHNHDHDHKIKEDKKEHKHDHGHHHHGIGGGHGGHGHSHENMNIRAAIIHIIGDIVQSIGVVIAAIIIYVEPDWHIADPICTFIFTFLCIFTTIPIFRDCVSVLMEATPKEIDVVQCF